MHTLIRFVFIVSSTLARPVLPSEKTIKVDKPVVHRE